MKSFQFFIVNKRYLFIKNKPICGVQQEVVSIVTCMKIQYFCLQFFLFYCNAIRICCSSY